MRVVDELIEAGCDVNHADVLCVVDELIEAGCDVNHADVSGRRLLNYLVRGGVQSEAAVRRVLIEGADHDLVRWRYLTWCIGSNEILTL